MTVDGEIRETTVTIVGMEPAEDKDGNPTQWKVKCKWPWTPAGNQYPDNTFIDRSRFPTWHVDTKGQYPVKVAADGIKRQGKTKQEETGRVYYDGQMDWMWNWKILRMLDHAPTPTPAASPSGGQTLSQDDRQKQISWNSAVNNAVHLVPALFNTDELMQNGSTMEKIHQIAFEVYQLIVAGPPQSEPKNQVVTAELGGYTHYAPEGSEMAVAGPGEAEPTQRPRPRAQVGTAAKQWNFDNPGHQITQEVLLEGCQIIFDITESEVGPALDALSPEQGLALATSIAKGEFFTVLADKKLEAIDGLPF